MLPSVLLQALPVPPSTTEVSVSLPVGAAVAFEAFADAGDTPRWLSMVHAADVVDRGTDGRPRAMKFRVAFDSATLSYVLHYHHDADQLLVTWATRPGSPLRVEGQARFTELSARACLMSYRLSLELPVTARSLKAHYDGHAASAVVGDFREYLRRRA